MTEGMVRARRLKKPGMEYYDGYFHGVDEVGERAQVVTQRVSRQAVGRLTACGTGRGRLARLPAKRTS